ncbi:MAG: hypothetical protein ABSF92_04755 [Candidatus Acidiferrales bacterium]
MATKCTQDQRPTALYDAMVSYAKEMSKSDPGPGLRAMFIFSDGIDNASRSSKDQTARALANAGIRVYAVGKEPKQDRDSKDGTKRLKQFAQNTCGKAYFPRDEKEIDEAVAQIAEELNNLFLVVYTPADEKRGGGLHELKVTCTKRGVSIAAPGKSLGK